MRVCCVKRPLMFRFMILQGVGFFEFFCYGFLFPVLVAFPRVIVCVVGFTIGVIYEFVWTIAFFRIYNNDVLKIHEVFFYKA